MLLALTLAISGSLPGWSREAHESYDDYSPYPDRIGEINASSSTYIELPSSGLPEGEKTIVKLQKVTPVKTTKAEPILPQRPVYDLDYLYTSWGFGVRENKYNASILKSVNTVWPHENYPLDPMLLKSLLAAESSFNPTAVSPTGAVGIAQLTPDSAKRFGLNWTTVRDPQYAIPAGVQVLAEKAQAILNPGEYHKLLGIKPESCAYALNVANAYEVLGAPDTDQAWPLILAAYNGGGGTILRAMSTAWKRGLDPRDWNNLVGDRRDPSNAPLYLACVDIYRWGAPSKYKEIADYPVRIMKYCNAAKKY